jgi:metal-responsive CopG/Arc/MetJ family transcriptional regulator
MNAHVQNAVTIPPALLAEVQAAAKEEHRAPDELVSDALRRYLEGRRHDGPPHIGASETAYAAIERIRELRQGNFLPEGVTIRDLIGEGRA